MAGVGQGVGVACLALWRCAHVVRLGGPEVEAVVVRAVAGVAGKFAGADIVGGGGRGAGGRSLGARHDVQRVGHICIAHREFRQCANETEQRTLDNVLMKENRAHLHSDIICYVRYKLRIY